ncbi:HoxN/HupN/NixA family nickel/cobalt transporter [Paenibacillus sacheonensis]|uniref:Nickel/cobalt efflux system n=1 Tax=Paenibacillus sacheonensis TaxID=742054 RepID=A0A7X4YKT7_9BACL|nr:HoxN/HupN/NixA family nickel/cobalt transporter [Paenibacillus sacheonensis]MBM7563223.1 high-affinity nickel-transport protein [Paenibacillus sacheonensis]NBC68216.1 HoxN/HupN/NixA family nickel/cobalt transporter [Paenibacillus sacheonensis]
MLRQLWTSRKSWSGYVIVVLLLHVLGLIGLIAAARNDMAFWSLGVLAYTLGMRHAFDVDHIAAIDNTVRKLVQQKRSPLGVGFYFSLGHSSVVFLMVLAIACSVKWIQTEMPALQETGSLIGTSVSGVFLILIGILNLIILVNLFQIFRRMRAGGHSDEELDRLLEARGLFARLFKPLFRFINRSWHVYPLGFLFGLGFDTATEVGLLALSAGAAKSSVSVLGILSLPLLFAAGMSLLDTADGMFMTKAYRWAFHTPLRKMYYNVTVTTVSVVSALLIGAVELIQIMSERLHWTGPAIQWVNGVELGDLGYILVGLFVAAWLISFLIWKTMKIDERTELSG